MEIVTKAKLNLAEGTIELEGTETFVSKYLEEFKASLSFPQKPSNLTQERIPVKVAVQSNNQRKSQKRVPKTSSANIKPEEFEDKPSNRASLKDFFAEKNPSSSSAQRIAVIGYFIKSVLKKDTFTEGNIEFGYKALDLTNRPVNLHQAFLDSKNKQKYIESSDSEGQQVWRLSRLGEIFVEEKLPQAKPSNAT